MSRRLMLVYGTRPEAIKMAPLVLALQQCADFEPVVVVTGQHTTLLSQVHEVFGITPDIDLKIAKAGMTLDDTVAATIEKLGHVLDRFAVDAAIVHGDTSTTLAAGLTEFQHKVPLVHLEAGLRTGDLYSPFPEEGNRRLVSQISTLHLAPTPVSRDSLLAENIAAGAIHVVGNTAIDALDLVMSRGSKLPEPVATAVADGRPIVSLTAHRRESWGEPLRDIGRGLAEVARRHPEALCVAPLHPNPLVREAILPQVEGLGNVLVCEPMNYVAFAHLLSVSSVLLSDSGGIQEEAPAAGVPLGVLRESTERPEVIASGQAVLLGTDPDRIEHFVDRVLSDSRLRQEMTGQSSPFGDGHAARRSIQALRRLFDSASPVDEFHWDGQERGETVRELLSE